MRGVAAVAWSLGCACLPLLGGGCAREVDRPAGPAVVARLDEHRSLGEPVVAENLTVWPVHTDRPLDIGEFLTLAEAQEKGVAVVREVGTAPPPPVGAPAALEPAVPAPDPAAEENGAVQVQQLVGGSGAVVNTLVLENTGDLPILVCAGTVVKGGQQDRQIGQDFVIAARSTVNVDAFCVEPGRWSGVAEFASTGQVAVKAVRASAQYEKDQGKVWDQVRDTLGRAGVRAESETLVAAQEQVGAQAVKRREDLAHAVAARFAALGEGESAPVGFAYAVNGKPVTVRAFAHPRIFRKQFDAFLKAMCMEAELARSDEAGAKTPARVDDVVALVKGLNEAQESVARTDAANENGYRTTDTGFNGNCYIPSPSSPGVDLVVTQDWTAR